MEVVDKLKTKLQQKKNKLAAEEIKLALKERKMRTRHLIELGGLVVKAGLDHLEANTLYGALFSLKQALIDNPDLQRQWTEAGKAIFDKEAKSKTAIILKLNEKPAPEIRTHIREHGLKWNTLRQEWYGYCLDLDALKKDLQGIEFNIEKI